MDVKPSIGDLLYERLASRHATVGIIGLGYVGLPLASAAANSGFSVIGFDVDASKIDSLMAGKSYIDAVGSDEIACYVGKGRLSATADFAILRECDVIVICVPTPLSKQREPDLSYVISTANTIVKHLRPGQLVVLESTTWPGTTEQVLKPILLSGGLVHGRDFWTGYSPEREDPGDSGFHTATTPKIVAGDGEMALSLVTAFYQAMIATVVPVTSPAVAEAAKITENVFRAVNIALVNELKVIYGAMGIDIWEVIEAASTKPFGFMPFFPGPGLGGHCIPIDPFYLAWKARECQINTRFIELAGEINVAMPHYVIGRLGEELDKRFRKSIGASKILVLGLAYKKNVSDIRESPALKLIELLEARGAQVQFHDPHVGEVPMTREHAGLAARKSCKLSQETLEAVDAVLIATDHDAVDYSMLAEHASLVIDTRNAMRRRGIACRGLALA